MLNDNIGYVELLETFPTYNLFYYGHGNDFFDEQITTLEKRVVEAARVSYLGDEVDNKDRNSQKDIKLLKYLWVNNHGSPFEMVDFLFRIKTPIFVARQWFRHRIGSFNETSFRYTQAKDEWYLPTTFRKQATTSKQASTDDVAMVVPDNIVKALESLHSAYLDLLVQGVAKEQARIILPQAMYTTFIWKVNLRSLMNFIEQRTSEHAQWEIRQYANEIGLLIKEMMPNFYKIYMDNKEEKNGNK